MPQLELKLPGNLSLKDFLRQYWQKKPLLIPQGLPGFTSPISAEELAGLACESEVESRIVMEKDDLDPWTLRNGPFEESDFSKLPESHWTLLVQECNKYVPELAELLDAFNFIPNWRVDDAMVSYAVPQGSVGPHLDQYDVFLIQAQGERRWQINDFQYREQDFLSNCDLRILKEFQAQQDWLLKPGDILYVPPGVAHYGVAQTNCITISIGFRAPNHYQLLSSFIDDYFANQDDFYIPRISDPDRTLNTSPGLIDDNNLENIVEILSNFASDPTNIKRWFARYITEPRNESDAPDNEMQLTADEFINRINNQEILYRSEYTRFAYICLENTTYLYIDGYEKQLADDLEFAATITCDNRIIPPELLSAHIENADFIELILDLVNESYFYFED